MKIKIKQTKEPKEVNEIISSIANAIDKFAKPAEQAWINGPKEDPKASPATAGHGYAKSYQSRLASIRKSPQDVLKDTLDALGYESIQNQRLKKRIESYVSSILNKNPAQVTNDDYAQLNNFFPQQSKENTGKINKATGILKNYITSRVSKSGKTATTQQPDLSKVNLSHGAEKLKQQFGQQQFSLDLQPPPPAGTQGQLFNQDNSIPANIDQGKQTPDVSGIKLNPSGLTGYQSKKEEPKIKKRSLAAKYGVKGEAIVQSSEDSQKKTGSGFGASLDRGEAVGMEEDLLPGGVADDMSDEEFDERELEMGIEDEESDHTNNPEIAKEIAKDHLKIKPHYYSDLKKSGLEENFDYNQYREWLNNKVDEQESKLLVEAKLSKYWRVRGARRAKNANRSWPNKIDREWALGEQVKSQAVNNNVYKLFEKELEESEASLKEIDGFMKSVKKTREAKQALEHPAKATAHRKKGKSLSVPMHPEYGGVAKGYRKKSKKLGGATLAPGEAFGPMEEEKKG